MEVIIQYIHMIGLSVWLGSMVLWAVFAPQLYKIDPTKKEKLPPKKATAK